MIVLSYERLWYYGTDDIHDYHVDIDIIDDTDDITDIHHITMMHRRQQRSDLVLERQQWHPH